MSTYYSKTTNGFYSAEMQPDYVAAGTWPADAVEITDAQYSTLMAAQSSGQSIQADANGNPISVAPTAPTAAQIAVQTLASTVANAFTAGLAITSTGTPAINGTYALGEATQSKIAAMVLTIQVNGAFPGSLTAYPWPDTSGAFHTFPSVAVFKAWATAISNYVAALDLYAAGAPGATLPASSVIIA